jgi:hypothetical protein
MLAKLASFLERGFNKNLWFRRGLAIAVLVLVFRMTNWGMSFAEATLAAKASLLDAAALVAAVGGIPTALLTILFNKYTDTRPYAESGQPLREDRSLAGVGSGSGSDSGNPGLVRQQGTGRGV